MWREAAVLVGTEMIFRKERRAWVGTDLDFSEARGGSENATIPDSVSDNPEIFLCRCQRCILVGFEQARYIAEARSRV